MHPSAERRCGTFALALAIAGLGGCADLTYDRVRIGAAPAEYERVLPAATTRPTAAGLAHLDARGDAGDAIVVLLTEQRRVAGKFLVRRRAADPQWMMRRRPGFHLVGELDPLIYGVEQTSPVDVVRLIIGELNASQGETIVRDAHAWVAAGLRRWLERWPGQTDAIATGSSLSDALGLAPAGGALGLQRGSNGRLHFEYRAD